MFVRDQPHSVRFMIIVSDALNLSHCEVIKVTREVPETTPMICSPQAPLEMVLMKPLLPRPKEKPLIGQTHADRAIVGKIDKPNPKIVALRDDSGDSAKGTESQINDVAKIERDKVAEAKIDAVAESKTGEIPLECGSKTNVERSTEAPQQTQQSQQPSSSTCNAGTSAQQTVEQVVDVPVATEAGAGVQRTVEQIIDVPDDVEKLAQQRPVEQIVGVATETSIDATPTLDRADLDVDAASAAACEGQGRSERRSPRHGAGQTALQARQRALGKATARSFCTRASHRISGLSGT